MESDKLYAEPGSLDGREPRGAQRRRSQRRNTPQSIRANKRAKRAKGGTSKKRSVQVTVDSDAHSEAKTGKGTAKVLTIPRGRFHDLKVPKQFSLLDAPDETLAFISKLGALSGPPSVRHIRFEASDCQKMGLDALVAMSLLILKAKRQRRENNLLTVSGTWPTDISMKIMFKASGIPHHLGLPEARLAPGQEELVHRCELFSGKELNLKRALSPDRNEATQDLRRYFNNCLRTVNFELTRSGKSKLDKLISEVIGNAQEHGGPWHTIGHWQRSENSRFGTCHIVLLNYGPSIYESFLTPEASPKIVEQLRSLSDLHIQRGFFSKFRENWDEEVLWTLYAMQERVSRFAGLPGHETRGNGTRDIVEFFLNLGSPGEMCVVSGHAYILFDGKYKFQEIKRGNEKLKVITFNESMSFEDPPDRRYVRRMKDPFHGTMVSIRLTLDEEYLSELTGADHDPNNHRPK